MLCLEVADAKVAALVEVALLVEFVFSEAHRHACELTEIALAVAAADSSAFPEFADWLYEIAGQWRPPPQIGFDQPQELLDVPPVPGKRVRQHRLLPRHFMQLTEVLLRQGVAHLMSTRPVLHEASTTVPTDTLQFGVHGVWQRRAVHVRQLDEPIKPSTVAGGVIDCIRFGRSRGLHEFRNAPVAPATATAVVGQYNRHIFGLSAVVISDTGQQNLNALGLGTVTLSIAGELDVQIPLGTIISPFTCELAVAGSGGDECGDTQSGSQECAGQVVDEVASHGLALRIEVSFCRLYQARRVPQTGGDMEI